jgi:hypothetical protein
VNCFSCGHENPPNSRFCLECGAVFGIRCAGCGAELPATAKFCNACGQAVAAKPSPGAERQPRDYTPRHLADKILQSKSALEGERKQVTVLFADVKGSMELAEQVDPEAWHRIRARSTSTPATGSWRSSERRSLMKTTHSAPATRRCTCGTSLGATQTSYGSIAG